MSDRLQIWFALLFIAALSWFADALATTITVVSNSAANVQAAIDSASTGDTVQLLTNQVTWSGAERVTCNKAIEIRGGGKHQTIFVDATTSGDGRMWSLTAPSTGIMWVHGFTLTNSTKTVSADFGYNGCIQLFGNNTTNRIICLSDIGFEHIASWNIYTRGAVGLITRCDFTNADNILLYTYHDNWIGPSGATGYGDGAWNAATDWNGTNWLVVEDCKFRLGFNYAIADHLSGARTVFRYNSITNGYIEVHGTDSGQRLRGGRAIAVYGNTFASDLGGGPNQALELRSGTALFLSNSISQYGSVAVQAGAYRTFYGFTPWGYADGTNGWDLNVSGGPFLSGTVSGNSVSVSSLTRSGTTVTVTTSSAHGYSSGNQIHILGANQGQYNGTFTITVTDSTHFTYTCVNDSQATPATGTITANKHKTFVTSGLTNNALVGYTLQNNTTAKAAQITGNTTTTITFLDAGTFGGLVTGTYTDSYYSDMVMRDGDSWSIYKVDLALDQAGTGQCDLLSNTDPATPRVWPNQVSDPIAVYGNTLNGSAMNTVGVGSATIIAGRNYTNALSVSLMTYPSAIITTLEGGCTYSIAPSSAPAVSSGTSDSFNVTAGTGCAWTAVVNAPADTWLHITGGSSGTGSGTVSWTADANTGTSRSGTITAAGYTYTVNQDAAPTRVIVRPHSIRRR